MRKRNRWAGLAQSVAADEYNPVADRRERRRALVAAVAWLGLAPLLLAALLRLVSGTSTVELVALRSFTFWLYLPAWLLLILGIFLRRGALSAAALGLVVCHLVWIRPATFFARRQVVRAAESLRFRVVSANLLGSNRDASGIVGEIRAFAPEVLLVQELTEPWQSALGTLDFPAAPAACSVARDDSFGIAVYSRWPMECEQLLLEGLPAVRAVLQSPRGLLHVLNFHTLPPRTRAYLQSWQAMMKQVVVLARTEAHPLLLGGDLNATPFVPQYDELIATGLRAAHEEVGRGYATTWPNGLLAWPPIRLDHLFLSDPIEVLSIEEGVGRGSDHRPLLAEVSY